MAWELTPSPLIGMGAAAVSLGVALQAWRHRGQRGARAFVALMIALAGWSLASGIKLGFTTPAEQAVWHRIGLTIGGTVPTLWLLFVLRYAGYEEWLTRPRQAALVVDPFAFTLLTVTNPVHDLVWEAGTLTGTAAGPVLALSLGVGYYLHIAYAYLAVSAGLVLLGVVLVRASPVYRRQTGFLILGAFPPFIANIGFTLRVPFGPLPTIDPTPFLFAVTGLVWALALFQFDLLERAPIARRRVLEEMGDGLVVLDTDGRVVEVNGVAGQVLDPAPRVGDAVATIVEGAGTTRAALEALDGRTVTGTTGTRERAHDVEWSTLTDRRGEPVGHMLALRDVTDRNEYEQRLEVSQRVLRHNLRNDMAVVRGWADQLAETAGDGRSAAARRIVETADDLIDLSEKTHTMVRLDPAEAGGTTTVDVDGLLADLVAEFRDAHPAVTIEHAPGNGVTLDLPGTEFLEVPVRNLLENAIEHNDADEPWVRVRLEDADGRIRIHVGDDGPEIPAMEREVLEDGTEGQIEHGSGIGLWLTYWSVTAVGGRVEFSRRDPRGNVVTLEFPTARDRQAFILLP